MLSMSLYTERLGLSVKGNVIATTLADGTFTCLTTCGSFPGGVTSIASLSSSAKTLTTRTQSWPSDTHAVTA